MRHRIFIAINLPEDIKKELLSFQEKYTDLPIKWTKKDNLHITLIFIGNVRDDQILEINKALRNIVISHQLFSINLNRICYGPPEIMPPRMVWAEGEKIKELTNLKNDLQKSLIDSKIHFTAENREFRPHITLGRVRQWEWQRIEPEERPEINEETSLSFEVKSIELMESRLSPKGSEYTILETIKLKS